MYESQVSSSSYTTCAILVEVKNYHELSEVFGPKFSDSLRNSVISRLLKSGVLPGVTAYSEGTFVIRTSGSPIDSEASPLELKKLIELIRSRIESEPVDCSAGRAYLKLLFKEYPFKENNLLEPYNSSDTSILSLITQKNSSSQIDILAASSILDELRSGNLILAFQPIVMISSPQDSIILYSEALLRRYSPQTQDICSWPNAIEALERTGLISRLDFSVIWSIISLLKSHPTQYLGCNVSASTMNPDHYWNSIIEFLDKHRNIAKRLTIEITETSNFYDFDKSLMIISDLKACGVGIAIDDFGSGNTPIHYLAKIRPDIIKIDRSILLRSRDPHYSPDLLRNFTKVCHDYTPCVVIEGIENTEELAAAQYAGGQCIQGFLIQHPDIEPAWLNPHQAVVSDILSIV
ncbi:MULTISPECIES: EAL domain-containing protein [unclassified Pseudomonas]|uniref:EAL domain-containing protein n=1 Tax=unclassified Pseudomonas TaxID=196821 RepID=UPI000C87FD30|nr:MULTISPECIES: EAL domain-containing protein [unclassified Pseudomonas]PMX13644.1 hypothetical protein C1Y23_31545 [Pseudomonas sp. GW460-12]PMX31195.1 hypothetical protein C1Y24_25730 [Pseudomonas sp. MPR-R2A4]PMX36677.1 hypothetical protein C1Y26_26215 [Pseudomonas sp. MPR-R2A7]PMX53211.1 hypothetical protein C1Y17_15195 [Pseudomonas sp. MPR-R2A6]PMX93517.1 hypothetical protein C1Y21_03410 [Pseudomonas sp. MPR-R2A3]